jgi:hypothetical protein
VCKLEDDDSCENCTDAGALRKYHAPLGSYITKREVDEFIAEYEARNPSRPLRDQPAERPSELQQSPALNILFLSGFIGYRERQFQEKHIYKSASSICGNEDSIYKAMSDLFKNKNRIYNIAR